MNDDVVICRFFREIVYDEHKGNIGKPGNSQPRTYVRSLERLESRVVRRHFLSRLRCSDC